MTQAFTAGAVAQAGGLGAGWLETARALDLFALVDLAARARSNPVVDQGRQLLGVVATTGSLAAGRPAPSKPARPR